MWISQDKFTWLTEENMVLQQQKENLIREISALNRKIAAEKPKLPKLYTVQCKNESSVDVWADKAHFSDEALVLTLGDDVVATFVSGEWSHFVLDQREIWAERQKPKK